MPAPLFVGSGVALVTPFREDGIDEAVLRDVVRFQIREGTDALVVNGSTGEAATMSPAEQRRAIEVVVEETNGRIPVIAGCGGSDTAVVAKLARAAREVGADALLVSAPPYNKPPQSGLVAHFRVVLAAGDLPLIVYNVPSRTACNLLPATIEEIAADPRVVGVKEASGNIVQVAELARRLGERLTLYSGNDDQVVALLALGGKGVISVLGNIAPASVSRMVHRFLDGDLEGARALQLGFLPLIAALFSEPNPIPIKTAMRAIGFPVGATRLPLVPMSEAGRGELLARMREMEIGEPEGAHA
jgi:4-hydroxy-tetrahydrodipicolinate synthase